MSPKKMNDCSAWLLALLLLIAGLSGACTEETDAITPDTDAGVDVGHDTTEQDTDSDTGPDAETDAPRPHRLVLDFEEGCNPLASTTECLLPFPSSFFEQADATTATGVRLTIPQAAVDAMMPAGRSAPDVTPFNRADGSPPTSPVLIHLGRDVAPEHLTTIHELESSLSSDNPFVILNADTRERVLFMSEMDRNLRNSRNEGRHALIVRPQEPMQMGARHIVALRGPLTDVDGEAIEAAPGFAALRDRVPTIHDEIEDVRARYEEIFEILDEQGYPRQDLLLAWEFTVASEDFVLGPILSMRETMLEMAGGTGLGYTITDVQDDPNDNTARIIEGTFEVPTFLRDDNTIDFGDDNRPVLQDDRMSFPFTMVIPQKARLGEPLPLTILGHGIFGEGRDYLTGSIGRERTQPLAQEGGSIVVATDWIGLSGGDIDLIIAEVAPDLNRLGLVTDRLQQSLINNLTLIELTLGTLQHDPWVAIGENDLLDSDRVYYYGVSLGGIQGSSLVSLSRHISRAILAVPGSSWASMLTRSSVYAPIKSIMDPLYSDALLQQVFVGLMQSRFDHSDPANVGLMMFRQPLPDAPTDRRVILQEAIADCQVPNQVTRILARTLGVKLLTPNVEDVFGLETVEGPTAHSAMSQYLLPDSVAAYSPPEENTVPSQDNGTHSDIVFMPNAQQQVLHLFETGEIAQFCDGMCDPD